MVITDCLPKEVFLFGMSLMTSKEYVKIFIDSYYRYHRFPRFLLSHEKWRTTFYRLQWQGSIWEKKWLWVIARQ